MSDLIPTGPPVAGTDADTMIGGLERQRRTFAWKAEGLDTEGLNTRIGASVLTIGGLLKHLARVEDEYATHRLRRTEPVEPWASAPLSDDDVWEFTTAADDSPEELYELWAAASSRCRAVFAEMIAEGGLDQPGALVWPDGARPSIRTLLMDLIEEYGRHTGQTDLLREAIDGRVGEDAPDDFVVPNR